MAIVCVDVLDYYYDPYFLEKKKKKKKKKKKNNQIITSISPGKNSTENSDTNSVPSFNSIITSKVIGVETGKRSRSVRRKGGISRRVDEVTGSTISGRSNQGEKKELNFLIFPSLFSFFQKGSPEILHVIDAFFKTSRLISKKSQGVTALTWTVRPSSRKFAGK